MCVAVIETFSVLPVPSTAPDMNSPSLLSRSTSLMLLSGWVGVQGSCSEGKRTHMWCCAGGATAYYIEAKFNTRFPSLSLSMCVSFCTSGRRVSYFSLTFFFHRPLFYMFCSACRLCPVVRPIVGVLLSLPVFSQWWWWWLAAAAPIDISFYLETCFNFNLWN